VPARSSCTFRGQDFLSSPSRRQPANRFCIGALVSTYSLPGELESFYGSGPTSYVVFARVKIL
jgi:hypothetical protein